MRERLKTYMELLGGRGFARFRQEINRSNRVALRVLAYSGIPLSIANILAQSIIQSRGPLSLHGSWLLLYFIALAVLEHFLPEDFPHATALIYVIEAPVLLISILLGTVWDPDHQALTFLMFLVAMPAYILDRPFRLVGVTVGWCVLFYALCLLVKNPGTHRGDFFHLLEFFLAAESITYVSLTVRMLALRSLKQARHSLLHDELTGIQNRRALSERLDRYVGKNLTVFMGDVDQLTLYNDLYGHDTGNEILIGFAETLSGLFGEQDSYRYGGDEMLCLAVDCSEGELLERMDRCREAMKSRTFGQRQMRITCSFGYTTGCPATAEEFQDMVRLADIYAHKGKSRGREQTEGAPFDARSLREAIAESSISIHAGSYEINALTGLPALSYFVVRAEELLEYLNDQPNRPVVGFFNLIQFRDFNDAFGYAQGDQLIRYTAGLLRKHFPNRHLCYITGSRFGIVCFRDEVEKAMLEINRALESYRPGFPVRSKAGFAVCSRGEGVMSLMDKAKAAHDSIYRQTGLSWRFYDRRLDAENRFRQYIVNHVDQAIREGWLTAYYQPIVRSLTGEVCNEEALCRWNDPRYGFLSPADFIPTLEENRQLWKVSLHMVRSVLKGFRVRQEAGVPVVPVSVNLSRYDFEQCDMVEEISRMVDESGYSRSMLIIEITESALMSNQEMLKREVKRFREAGFAVWMDDFGSEYSTLNLLQDLEFDLIKIDMQFMRNFSGGGRNRIIVSDILDMARRMGMSTLIEGVETRKHFALLRQMGCEKLQGYLFNRPQPQSYIIERCRAGTGLTFEDPARTDYFSAVGRVDLAAPLSGVERVSAFSLTGELPAGVLEQTAEGLFCVRSNRSFLDTLVGLELTAAFQPPSVTAPGAEEPPGKPVNMASELKILPLAAPASLETAARKCRDTEDWCSALLTSESVGGRYALYLHRVAVDAATGDMAMLGVLLPADH